MSATFWLVVIVALTIGLFVIAFIKRRMARTAKTFGKSTNTAMNNHHDTDLNRADFNRLGILYSQVVTILPATLQAHKYARHLAITQDTQTLALLTLDDKLPTGERTLNGTLMINFRHNPSDKELYRTLAKFIATDKTVH
ncbi:MAG: hypothetical protein Q4G13_00465 [Moraxella sp.]|nr:hypothetical protein [Moraxella sp.]